MWHLCGLQVDPDVIAANPKLQGVNLNKVLLPAATLRPDAAQYCIQAQVRCLTADTFNNACRRCNVGAIKVLPLPVHDLCKLLPRPRPAETLFRSKFWPLLCGLTSDIEGYCGFCLESDPHSMALREQSM